MDNEDVLAAANTALLLGDWFYPPPGSLLMLTDDRGLPITPGCYMVRGRYGDEVFILQFRGGTPWYARVRHPYLLVELPADCPPFEQWERPRRGVTE